MDLDLAVVALPGTNAAAEAFAAARDRPGPHKSWVSKVGLVEHHTNGHMVLRGSFAGHYVDVDEALGVSQHGEEVGFVAGAAIGFLLGPLGFAEGVVLGPTIGSKVGKPDEVDREPEALVEQLRHGIPPSTSAIVVIAPAQDVAEFLAAVDQAQAKTVTRTLGPDDVAVLEASLSTWPAASWGPSLKGEQAVEDAGAY